MATRGRDLSSDEARDLGTGVAKASERLRRLVGNLAAAARLDLSPPDEPVEVGVHREEGGVHLDVADRGPGVPAEQRERIFDAFTQADTSDTCSHEPLGIGLFLARRIVTAHLGNLTHGDREGGGSVFSLTFPAHPQAPRP